MSQSQSRSLAAEATGTFALCFVGLLAISAGNISGNDAAVGLTSIAFAHGLTIAVMVASLGAISGAHFNPAVTFGFMVTGRMTPARGLLYWAAQLGGALLASLLVAVLFGTEVVAAGTPVVDPLVTPAAAAVLEAVATFFLVLVIFGTAVDERAPRGVFPLAIGLTIVLDIMAIGPITGGAMNPARAFGPALVGGQWGAHWIYWIGPLLGGAAGAWLQHGFLMSRAPSPEVAERGGPAPSEKRGRR
jgi:aquaporin Z